MTVENCVDFCNAQNLIYAGVEFGQECCEWYFNVVHGFVLFPFPFILIILSGI